MKFDFILHFCSQAISELPQPNRDTLAYLIVHLQAVAQVTYIKILKLVKASHFNIIAGYHKSMFFMNSEHSS